MNRDIIETMVHAYSKIFGTRKPVFDGRSNLYTRDPLPIGSDAVELEVTLPGEGKDRVFRVTMKWAAQVGLNLQYILNYVLLCPLTIRKPLICLPPSLWFLGVQNKTHDYLIICVYR